MKQMGRVLQAIAYAAVLATAVIVARAQPAERPAEFSGTVVDADGKPVGGAEVVFGRQVHRRPSKAFIGVDELERTHTAADGSFRMRLPAEAEPKKRAIEFVRATADGYAYGYVSCERMPNGPQFFSFLTQQRLPEPRIILPPEARLTGTVTGPAGAPVAGAEVIHVHVRNPVKTDADGRFAFDKVSPQQVGKHTARSGLTVRHPDFVERTVELRGGLAATVETLVDVPIALDPGVVLSGRLGEEDTDRPLVGYAVLVSADRGDFNGAAYSDAEGRYAVRVPPGRLRLRPMAGMNAEATKLENHYPAEPTRSVTVADGKDLAADQTDFMFRRGQAVAVTLRLTGDGADTAKLPEGLFFDVAPADAAPGRASAGSQHEQLLPSDGKFRVERLWPGRWTIRLLTAEARVVATETVEVVAGREVEHVTIGVPVNRDQRLVLKGRLLLPDGKPAVGAAIVVVDAAMARGDGGRHRETAGADGSFIVEGVDLEKAWDFTARDATGAFALVRRFTGPSDLEKPLELTLLAGAEVAGTVVDENDKPLADIMVAASRETKQGRMTSYESVVMATTDAQGRYRIAGIATLPGEENTLVVTVVARDVSGGAGDRPRRAAMEPVRGLNLGPGKKVEALNFRVRRSNDSITVERLVPNEGL